MSIVLKKQDDSSSIDIEKRPAGALKMARRRRMTLAWSVWLVAAVFVFFQFYLQLSSGEMVDGLMKTFSLTAVGGGLLASTYYYVYVLLQVPAGMLMDRYGPRLLLSVGALVVAASLALFAKAPVVWVAMIARVFVGAGAAFAFVGCLNLIAKWFPQRRFAVMVAIVEGVGMLGAILGELFLASLVHRVGWRNCMLASSVVAGVIAILLWTVIRNTPKRKSVKSLVASSAGLWLGVKHLLSTKIAWINGIYSGIAFSIVTVFSALWAVPFIEYSHHVTLLVATASTVMVYVGVIFGGPMMGWLDGRTNWRRIILVGSTLIAAVLLTIVIFWVSLPIWVDSILMFCAGFFASAYILTFSIASEIAQPESKATSIGFTNMLCVLTAPILQPLVGLLMHLFSVSTIVHGHVEVHRTLWGYQLSVALIPSVMVVAAGLGFLLPYRQRQIRRRK